MRDEIPIYISIKDLSNFFSSPKMCFLVTVFFVNVLTIMVLM